MKLKSENHTFVVCAYKESVFLEKCLDSLIKQTKKCNIIIATSTPNDYLNEISEKYQLKLFVNYGENGIAEDWNFGYSCCDTELITIAHQDDIYYETYLEEMLKIFNKAIHPLLAFSDYYEIREEKVVKTNTLLKVKRLMLFPLRFKIFHKSRFIRRRILSFGSPICCPSVTYMKNNLPDTIFKSEYRSDVDWQAWEKVSRLKGEFIYNSRPLMGHRIHEESATTGIIADNDRNKEDFEMFSLFWPNKIAKILASIYARSEQSNKM